MAFLRHNLSYILSHTLSVSRIHLHTIQTLSSQISSHTHTHTHSSFTTRLLYYPLIQLPSSTHSITPTSSTSPVHRKNIMLHLMVATSVNPIPPPLNPPKDSLNQKQEQQLLQQMPVNRITNKKCHPVEEVRHHRHRPHPVEKILISNLNQPIYILQIVLGVEVGVGPLERGVLRVKKVQIFLHVCFVVHQIKNGMKMRWICIIGR